MLKQTFWLENLIKYSPVIIVLLLSFKERENMAPSCKFNILIWHPPVNLTFCYCFMFVVEKIYKFTLWVHVLDAKYKQYIYSCLNRTEITENRHQKLKPNRTEPKKIWTVAALVHGVSTNYNCYRPGATTPFQLQFYN